MPDRHQLLDDEAAGAAAFDAVLATIPDDRWDETTVTPDGWTPITVVAHVAGWLDECSDVLEAMRAGTLDPGAPKGSVEAINARQASRAAALTTSEATASFAAARVRARAAWEALPVLTPDAWSWFEESGPNHYAKHVHDLSAWLAGETPDPDVGAMLQEDAERWVAFGALVDKADSAARDSEGWAVTDICFHVAAWFGKGADCVEHGAGWGPPWETDADRPTEEVNAAFLARSRAMTPDEARAALDDARDRLRAAFSAQTRPADGVKDVFKECTVDHYAEHVPMLRRLTGSEGSVA
ncbi:MAG TPA: maleylpyruvate isomerase N-terminal domain-containing protein [Actinomycetota bacterium]|nr:maleylpyruvate isomerase N-terminal domain-containing protein [Actinomycetota bacterium]